MINHVLPLPGIDPVVSIPEYLQSAMLSVGKVNDESFARRSINSLLKIFGFFKVFQIRCVMAPMGPVNSKKSMHVVQ